MHELSWLIHPFDRQTFLDEVWQREPRLLATGREADFAPLFNSASIEHILEFVQPAPPSVRFSDQAAGGTIEVPFTAAGRIDMEQVRREYLAGRTIILNMVENFDARVARLARAVETELGARVQVNCYLTPSGAQGFAAHYDTHDVLVVQIEGEKRWKIYGGESVCPLNEMTDGGPADRKDKVTPDEITLRAGDVLYIPRGWIHEAETQNSPALHLTFGIHPPLARDLVTAALEAATARRPELRRTLPPGPLARADREVLRAVFDEALDLVRAETDLEALIASLDGQFLRRGRSAGDGHLFADMDRVRDMTADTRLERRSNMPCRLVPVEDGVGLQFMNAVVKGPEAFRQAMVFVQHAREPFQVRDLPGLAPDHQLALAMSLVLDGLCRLPAPGAEIRALKPEAVDIPAQ